MILCKTIPAVLILALLATSGVQAAPATFTYSNPIGFQYTTEHTIDQKELRDPCIIRDGDTYYCVFTMWPFANKEDGRMSLPDNGSSPGIRIYSSKDLKNWAPGEWLVKSSELPEDCPYKHRFWAPEIHKINGKFYLIFTADNWLKKEYNPSGEWGYHAFVGVADKVTGPYRHITYIKDSACDTTIMDGGDGKIYAIMPFGDLFEQEIDLSRLEEDKITLGERKKILSKTSDDPAQSTPSYLEGPWGMKIGKRYYVFYAENIEKEGYWTGVAYADNPLGPWRKDPRVKLFEGGHLAVFQGPNDRPWFSYRGESGGPAAGRLCADPFTIAEDGTVQPIAPTTGPQTITLPPLLKPVAPAKHFLTDKKRPDKKHGSHGKY
ncbi:MAG: family 43 glycosylhydrolase [Capsulimonas sp.]|uniref:glycoside hydrolase family 43 protein n=1 Tax=Capsulimonas sp. TaxID=2494211 RepID=UPI00326471F9